MEGQRGFILVLFLSFLLAQVLCQKPPHEPKVQCPAGHQKAWNYNRPGEWGTICPYYATCANGAKQSPINLQLFGRPPVHLDVNLNFSAVNLIRVDKYVTMPIYTENLLTWRGNRYWLTRIEFHSPSEHTINGVSANLEVQLYYSYTGTTGTTQLAIALFYDRAICDDAFLSAIIPALPRRDRCECGNGRTEQFFPFLESCDVGSANNKSAGTCRPDCTLPRCGDGIKDWNEECDLGPVTKETAPYCRTGCITPKCGDGIKDIGEECDDGNRKELDGCSGLCKLECGDGCLNDPLEQCDLGKKGFITTPLNATTNPGSICRPDCLWARCGDGITDFGEECDDYKANGGDNVTPNGCRPGCKKRTCGDGVVDNLFNETCEPPGVGLCGADCRWLCGNGKVEAPEECDSGALNSNTSGPCRLNCVKPKCGDSIVDPGEQCDGGEPNLCTADCKWQCGDRVVDSALGEECDNGHPGIFPDRINDGNNNTRPNACRMNCKLPKCGDGVVDPVNCEECDNGAKNNNSIPNACREDCKKPHCGDRVVDSGEQCDDGNNNDDDGCSCCRRDCGNGIKQGTEECDDGAANSDSLPDRCRSNCKKHFCGDGMTDSDEECDPASGKVIGCTASCTRPFCGDGIVHFTLGEECDNGVKNSYTAIDGCSPICTLNVCGQTLRTSRVNLQSLIPSKSIDAWYYQGSETRPPCTENVEWLIVPNRRTMSNQQFIQFTNVIWKNNRPLQGANGRNPRLNPFSIDPYPARDPRAFPVCGNGRVEQGEWCDNGADNHDLIPNACRSNCRPARCGDGVVDDGEECDGQKYCTFVCKIDRRSKSSPLRPPCETCQTGLPSPIRLPANICPASKALNLNHPSNVQYNPVPLVLFNDGKKVILPTPNGGSFNWKGVSYALDRIEFKSPSEHFIGTKQFTLEVQLFHRSQFPVLGKSAVLSVLFDVGAGSNALQPLFDRLPLVSGFQCGNGIREDIVARLDGTIAKEECDAGSHNSDTVPNCCRTNCRLPYCGDRVIDAKETCDQGLLNANLPNRCRPNCVLPFCGDGIVDSLYDEECDDGNNKNGDGCTSLCRKECGNGLLEPNELCDDGVLNSDFRSDACRTSCVLPKCGDNVLDYGEECDNGNLNSDSVPDACRLNCTRPHCGDRVTDPSLGEECDGGFGCDSNCRRLCGNGQLDEGEQCDSGAANGNIAGFCRTDCTLPRCGDFVVDPDEECDAGPLNTIACNACKIQCPNGVLDEGEECDDGSCNSDEAPDACRTNCLRAYCGDNVLDSTEECDEGGANSDTTPNRCRTNCKIPRCGDGVVDRDEACDDKNTASGDGCSSSCQLECGNGRLDPGEECDSGRDNANKAACCRTNCKLPTCGDGVTDPSEQCDDGTGNSLAPNSCRPDCTLPTCGDSIVDHLFGEVCDQGGRNGPLIIDGCDLNCLPNAPRQSVYQSITVNPRAFLPTTPGTYHYSATASEPPCVEQFEWFVFASPQTLSSYQAWQFSKTSLVGNNRPLQPRNGRSINFFEVSTTCGDAVVEGDEECDNGPLNSDFAPNACRRNCRKASCGDGVQDKGEQCDGTPNCSSTCQLSCTAPARNFTSPAPLPDGPVTNNSGTMINVNFASILAQ